MSHKLIITLDVLDSVAMLDDLRGERWELTKVINVLSSVESGVMSASAVVDVDDAVTILCDN